MKRRSRSITPGSALPFNYTSLAILGGVFVLGVGIGIAFSSTATFSPENVASREFIDQSAPNPELCAQFGASAMAMDVRMFITLNPFNAYVTQPKIQPACVLRSANWSILEQRNLITPEESRNCRQRMNTFGFVGELERSPEINCVYQNKAAENLFLNQPGSGGITPPPRETNRF
ncbi:DUF3172 domain-containing protein [Trichothermofontia sp.]